MKLAGEPKNYLHQWKSWEKQDTKWIWLTRSGGKPTLDKVSISEDYDPEDKYKKIYESGIADNTTPLSEANAEEFDVVFIVGGHAAMYDLLAESQELQDLINTVYDNGNIV